MTHPAEPAPAPRHSAFHDAQGIVFGVVMVALSLSFLQSAGLITGQMAGLAVVLSYVSGWGFGPIFFVINLPFYALALMRVGLRFSVKTFAAVTLLSVLSSLAPGLIAFAHLHPATAAVLAGFTAGAGLLALFRHGSSLGGVGILALYLQDKTGFRAGWTQLCVDLLVFGLAFALLDTAAVLWSLLGAVVLNLVIAINHRRDHYVAL